MPSAYFFERIQMLVEGKVISKDSAEKVVFMIDALERNLHIIFYEDNAGSMVNHLCLAVQRIINLNPVQAPVELQNEIAAYRRYYNLSLEILKQGFKDHTVKDNSLENEAMFLTLYLAAIKPEN
ncbi:MAG: hypothetical protein A2Y21_02470 [Clostridiales bacterium GWC2_40_7]|nr:MAG: hypothetical protein A2Y21_02470 [Clostridiales bacterium GWC2_40_7]